MECLRKSVHAAHANAVQTARDFVGVRIELTTGVQFGHDNLGCRDAFILVHIHRNAATVIDHGDRIIAMKGDVTSVQYPAKASSTELSTTS